MTEELQLGDVSIDMVFEDIKNDHLSIRLFVISKLGWIKLKQRHRCVQKLETLRKYIERESHCLWGPRYLRRVVDNASCNYVQIDHRNIGIDVTKPADTSKLRRVLDSWCRNELRKVASTLIYEWQREFKVEIHRFVIQQMKCKWGSSSQQQK